MNKQDRKYAERFLKAADVIERIPSMHVDLGTFGEKTDCGTIACIAGHCSLAPWFRRRGFKGVFDEFGTLYPSDGSDWMDHIENFFGYLCNDTFVVDPCYLRNPRTDDFYKTPKSIAKGIRRFVKDKYGEIK